MIASTIYKEWLKIRYYWLAAFVFNIIVFICLFFDIRYLFAAEPAQMVWYNAIHIGTLFYANIRYLLPATGILIACSQFIPEINNDRLRLSLHLPVSMEALVLSYAFIGLFFVAVIALADSIVLSAIVNVFYPKEVVVSAILTALPWFFSGLIAYLGASLALLEPKWSGKIFNLVISAGFVWLFYQGNYYESYIHVIGKLALASMLFIPAMILPVYRYLHRT